MRNRSTADRWAAFASPQQGSSSRRAPARWSSSRPRCCSSIPPCRPPRQERRDGRRSPLRGQQRVGARPTPGSGRPDRPRPPGRRQGSPVGRAALRRVPGCDQRDRQAPADGGGRRAPRRHESHVHGGTARGGQSVRVSAAYRGSQDPPPGALDPGRRRPVRGRPDAGVPHPAQRVRERLAGRSSCTTPAVRHTPRSCRSSDRSMAMQPPGRPIGWCAGSPWIRRSHAGECGPPRATWGAHPTTGRTR